MCWEVESTLDLAIIQPSEEGNGDPGPFLKEMPAQPLGTLLLLYTDSSHVNYSCKISTVASQFCTGNVSLKVCLQGLSWPLPMLSVIYYSVSLERQEVWNVPARHWHWALEHTPCARQSSQGECRQWSFRALLGSVIDSHLPKFIS